MEIDEKMPKRRRKLKKKKIIQFLFCLISIIFIVGCFVFYGKRLVKYYKIYNPKTSTGEKLTLISTSIMSTSQIVYEGDGLYKTSNGSIYKGEKVNNYIKYSGLLWRIIKIGNDGSLDIVLDDYINILKWNKKSIDYNSSDINKYLKEKFLPVLDKDLITNTIVCDDIINNLSKVTCDKVDVSGFVRLLNINEFLNSKLETSYISDGGNIWLSNRGDEKVWNINDSNVSYSSSEETYAIKPVVTLKSSNILDGGKGTKEEPYKLREKGSDIRVGEYVKLGDDIWTVYDVNNKVIKLSLDNLLDTLVSYGDNIEFDLENSESIAKYLNKDYYESLSYKDLIVDGDWYFGEYKDSYKDIENKKVTAKVGLLSVADLKFNNELTGYYLLNGDDSKVYMYADMLILSKPTLYRNTRPAIGINNVKPAGGTGTYDDPYVLEAE